MCGICAVIEIETSSKSQHGLNLDSSTIRNRGPDACSQKRAQITSNVHGYFAGFTLHFQGSLTQQPLEDDQGNIFLWNGEVFGGVQVDCENDGRVLAMHLSKCETSFDLLQVFTTIRGPWAFVYLQKTKKQLWFGRCAFGRRSLLFHVADDLKTFALCSVACDGLAPWKEVPAHGIYCLQLSDDLNSKVVAEKLIRYNWINQSSSLIKSDLVFKSSNQNNVFEINKKSELFNTQSTSDELFWGSLQPVLSLGEYGILVPFTGFCEDLPESATFSSTNSSVKEDSPKCFNTHNDYSVPNCEQNGEEEGFIVERSDNVYVAQANIDHKEVKQIGNSQSSREAIECANSENITDIDSVSSHANGCQNTYSNKDNDTSNHISKVPKDNCISKKKMVPANVKCNESKILKHMTRIHDEMSDELIRILGNAVKVRVERQSHLCHNCITKSLASCNAEAMQEKNTIDSNAANFHSCASNSDTETKQQSSSKHSHIETKELVMDLEGKKILSNQGKRCKHARVGVLFSGGIDSLVIAALADRYVPKDEPIDLLNVAFEQKKQSQQKGKKFRLAEVSVESSFEVPDRITGRDGLIQLNSSRKWNFVEIDVTVEELQQTRDKHVRSLVYPLNTVLDDSIGCAVWFAARGRGVIQTEDGPSQYTTSARVMLVGMGADEQLAGYSRHRVKFQTNGWKGLIDEIKMEIERISARNLGRDDRIISDHSREARFPFLDENVVSFLNSLPIWIKADLNLPRGFGEKLLLRIAAHKLGLHRSSTLPKRAIQFGSRIAKIENKKEKGSDVCERL